MPDPANPDDPVGWLTAAINYGYEQDYTNALRCYQKATELNPDFIDAWGRMGLLLVKLGRFEEAHTCNARVRELNAHVSSETRQFHAATDTSHSPALKIPPSKRLINIFIAGTLSAICPGGGRVYNGERYAKGWIILAAIFLSALAGIFLNNFKGEYLLSPLAPYLSILPNLTILLPVLVWIYSIAEAIWISYTINKHQDSVVRARPVSLLKYLVITYVIAALMYLYFPMVSSALAGFLTSGIPKI
ncbi:tetratricopeptide repeat protein [Methanoregula sp.]|uniref:tetratricopeptide repeat protein n=1 Tax=Methanoregula sp. TaxID=2052170 RepID=UPI003C746446